jgi:hypothetical protein
MSTSWNNAVGQIASNAVAGGQLDDKSGARVVDRHDSADAIASCVDTLRRAAALAHIGHYTFGNPDFTVDTLAEHSAELGLDPDRTDWLLSQANTLGRNLYDYMCRFDAELAAAHTGTLIRFFLSANGGAVHWNEITEAQHLIALSLHAGDKTADAQLGVQRADDQAVSELANKLRDSLSQLPRDYGGWLAEGATIDQPPEPATGASAESVTVPSFLVGDPSVAADVCRDALDIQDMHYVALYSGGELVAAADILHHPRLDRFAFGVTPGMRRHFYRRFGSRLGDYARDLAATVFSVVGRNVNYLVLDVERGAVYYRRVRPGTYLVAVTLDQDQVSSSELKVADLAARLAKR